MLKYQGQRPKIKAQIPPGQQFSLFKYQMTIETYFGGMDVK